MSYGEQRLREGLEALRRRYDERFLDTDPVAFVHRFRRSDDQEVVGLVASSLAYGNVKTIRASLEKVMRWMGPSPAAFARALDPSAAQPALAGFRHRWTRARDVVCLVGFAGRMLDSHGSIGAFFAESHEPGAIASSLRRFSERALALDHGGAYRPRRLPRKAGVRFFFTRPETGACKRMNMYLRWMARPGDAVDLGLWPFVATKDLVLPLDTHLYRIGRHLGLSRRKTPGFATAVEMTRGLARADANDPVKYDFALSRLGMLENCPRHPGRNDCELCELERSLRCPS